MAKIRFLAKYPSGGASRATRHLILRSLSPKYDPSAIRGFHYVGDTLVPNPEPPLPPEVAVAEEDMKTYLSDALLSLKNIQSVNWKTEESDEEWAQAIVLNALKSYTCLVKLDVTLTHARIALPLDLLSNLQEIVFNEQDDFSDKSLNLETMLNLAKMIAQSPPGQITSISVNREWREARTTQAFSLHDLFQFYSPDAPPLRLRHLTIQSLFVRLDAMTIPHLLHLTSIHLYNISEPCREPVVRIGREGFIKLDVVSDDILERQTAVGTTLNQFWADLFRHSIYLQEIKLNNIVPGFLQYLTRYSGLKKLTISTLLFVTAAESDASAIQFFGDPLASHSESLEELIVHANYEGLWCFGEHNISTISKLKSLKVLDIAITSSNLKGGDSAEGYPEDIVKVLLDTVSVQLPRLRELRIQPAILGSHRGGPTGTHSFQHLSSVKKKVIRRVEEYKAPSYNKLPIVSIWADSFLPEPAYGDLEDGIGWRYRKAPDREIPA